MNEKPGGRVIGKHGFVSETARRLEDLCRKFDLVKDKSFEVAVAEYQVEGVKALPPYAIVPRDKRAFDEAVEQAQKFSESQLKSFNP